MKLYEKSSSKELDMELFRHPTSEYRGAPFWAWNTRLQKEALLKQIEIFKEMGLGGFHMHSRSGMASEYLGVEYMSMVQACTEKAKELSMQACLYDEDRWPSGSAGGMVTANPKHRQKYLLFTRDPEEAVSREQGENSGETYLLAAFDVSLNLSGELSHYEMSAHSDAPAKGTRWYAYVKTPEPSGWYNNQTYVDTLSPEAIEKFVEITHEKYASEVGEEFGKTIPSIFTDEPQVFHKKSLETAKESRSAMLPWTTDFLESFLEAYGQDLLTGLPELFWELPQGKVSQLRYFYHDHACERFVQAFSDTCGKWCEEHGLNLTGHMMEEPTLQSQTAALGEVMRCYRSFTLPGIDLLSDILEPTAAKQVQSAVHQFGREGAMCECYGVTNWDFDFRGHKFQGDWLAAMGITFRVPHLAWVSMKGSGKRDCPASISYQSPWYREYAYIEDHFARLGTVLTRGKALTDVAVIHPIESYWLHWGPEDMTANVRAEMDERFLDFTRTMLEGQIDFDFVSEALLPSLYREDEDTHTEEAYLHIGHMQYKTVIVPFCETLRSTTLHALEKFKKRGGEILFLGECPKYVDALPSDKPRKLYDACRKYAAAGASFIAHDWKRKVEIRSESGIRSNEYVYNLRQDGDIRWLFVAHAKKSPYRDDPHPERVVVRMKGDYCPKLYDTLTGEVRTVDYEYADGWTKVLLEIYLLDSVLLAFEEKGAVQEDTCYIIAAKAATDVAETAASGKDGVACVLCTAEAVSEKIDVADDSCTEEPATGECKENHGEDYRLDFKGPVSYHREELNVMLLDEGEYCLESLNTSQETGEKMTGTECGKVNADPMLGTGSARKFEPIEEVLQLDAKIRGQLGYPEPGGLDTQPWAVPERPYEHTVTMRYTFYSEIEVKAWLGVESAVEVTLNDQPVDLSPVGYYVDFEITKMALPTIQKGKNVLTITIPVTERAGLEPAYLLGDFDVVLKGTEKIIKAKSKEISFGSITHQGMPFYGGNVVYEAEVEVPECKLEITVPHYTGALVSVDMDGSRVGRIVYNPYRLVIDHVSAGIHKVSFTLYGNRFNTFGALHDTRHNGHWKGCMNWYPPKDSFVYEYFVREVGIMSSPVIRKLEK